MTTTAIRTPSGKVVEVDENALGAIVVLVEDARFRAYDEVLDMLEKDNARFRDCGDLATAELIEVIRAKVRAKRDPRAS